MSEKKLRSGLYADVKDVCEDVEKVLNVTFDPNATDLIAELVWKKILLYGNDLEAFSKHAKRSIITPDDVKLLCRRNASLMEFVEKECPPTITTKSDASSSNRKKRKISAIIIDD